MDKEEILVPILTAINDLREDVRENRKEIRKNREAIQKNSQEILKNREAIQKNSQEILKNREAIQRNSEEIQKNRDAILGNRFMINENRKTIISIEERIKIHEEERKKDRTDLLGILCKYESVTDEQYKENKSGIQKLEEKLKTAKV